MGNGISYWLYAVDIGHDGPYKSAGYQIKVQKEYIPSANDGASAKHIKYAHSHPKGKSYVEIIKHNGMKQSGFPRDLNYYKRVTTYFIHYDTTRSLPILVGITKDGSNYDYYKRSEHVNEYETWKATTVSGNVTLELEKINTKLSNYVIIKVDKTDGGRYYISGEDDTPRVHPNIQIQVSAHEKHPSDGYKRYTHKLSGGSQKMRVISTKCGNQETPFRGTPSYIFDHENVHVYYGATDVSHQHPLILEMGSVTSYFKIENDKWISLGSKQDVFKKELERLNCLKNGAHRIDITQVLQYTCLGCIGTKNAKNIDVTEDEKNGYIRRRHSPQGGGSFSVSSFFSNVHNAQTGIDLPNNVNGLSVFFEVEDPRTPLLLHYKQGGDEKWFQRDKTMNEWKAIDGEKAGKLKGRSPDDAYQDIKEALGEVKGGITNDGSSGGSPPSLQGESQSPSQASTGHNRNIMITTGVLVPVVLVAGVVIYKRLSKSI